MSLHGHAWAAVPDRRIAHAPADGAGGQPRPLPQSGGLRTGPGDAFGTWLEKGLRALYEPVMEEPIPQELLDLVRSMEAPAKPVRGTDA